jgi:hypothetical protein
MDRAVGEREVRPAGMPAPVVFDVLRLWLRSPTMVVLLVPSVTAAMRVALLRMTVANRMSRPKRDIVDLFRCMGSD